MKNTLIFLSLITLFACKKQQVIPQSDNFTIMSTRVGNAVDLNQFVGVNRIADLQIGFSSKIDKSKAQENVSLQQLNNQKNIPFELLYKNGDCTLIIKPKESFLFGTKYQARIFKNFSNLNGTTLETEQSFYLTTEIDTSKKFTTLSTDDLLTKIQQQTFKYFWDFGHPESGLSRERNSSGDIVTSGGSGFGIMAIVVAAERNFVTRQESVDRLNKITDFLLQKSERFHGAFPHWLNGKTGKAIAFSPKDNGADLVETSYLMQGLLTAREYYSQNTASESKLRKNITQLWNEVEWSWFTKNGEKKLYWHWSPTYGWDMNMPIKGWNECLITYILAASSPTFPIDKETYTKGWTENATFLNGKSYFGIKLPLGPAYGGPLFFSHYSFLGLNPKGLKDEFANYWDQNVAHSQINYAYCVNNPKKFYGYSSNCWGLTASDIQNGYTANDPTNDNGTITPTAAISSLPYTPVESMKAIQYFYYVLGDKTWKEYGFVDAFNLSNTWYADSFLAIDQGPIIIMIENYRTQLLWNQFGKSQEVKNGLKKLGFTY
ncbi:beta-glucosidase [Sandaracinomonas limnophila]|uniref:Beta-glucosidase n=2 Tax=Sandaracinomonas limnophila TaxID=1862386 RepID=A0A437PR87_9BACT|nr:beta-glucosidase [Sandaracinomonas limnophila]